MRAEDKTMDQSIRAVRDARAAAEEVVRDMENKDLRAPAFEIAFRHFLNPAIKRNTRPVRRKKGRSNGGASREVGERGGSPRRARSSRTGPQTLVRELIDDGFFENPREIAEVLSELRQRGHVFKQEDLGTPLRRLTQARQLRREEAGDEDRPARWKYRRAR